LKIRGKKKRLWEKNEILEGGIQSGGGKMKGWFDNRSKKKRKKKGAGRERKQGLV